MVYSDIGCVVHGELVLATRDTLVDLAVTAFELLDDN